MSGWTVAATHQRLGDADRREERLAEDGAGVAGDSSETKMSAAAGRHRAQGQARRRSLASLAG